MFVLKRNGKQERVQYDKISSRIEKLAYGLNTDFVDPAYITQKVIKGVYSGVTTVQLDTLAAETAAYLTTEHPDYSVLAARIAVSNLHKMTQKSFSAVMSDCYHCVDESSGRKAPLLADDVYQVIVKNKEELDSAIIYDRDYSYDYFGFKTLERSYLLRVNSQIAERPQVSVVSLQPLWMLCYLACTTLTVFGFPAAHVDACRRWHPQERHCSCDRNLQPHVTKVLHPRQVPFVCACALSWLSKICTNVCIAKCLHSMNRLSLEPQPDALQCGHTDPSDVVVLLGTHEGGLH